MKQTLKITLVALGLVSFLTACSDNDKASTNNSISSMQSLTKVFSCSILDQPLSQKLEISVNLQDTNVVSSAEISTLNFKSKSQIISSSNQMHDEITEQVDLTVVQNKEGNVSYNVLYGNGIEYKFNEVKNENGEKSYNIENSLAQVQCDVFSSISDIINLKSPSFSGKEADDRVAIVNGNTPLTPVGPVTTSKGPF